MSRILRHKSCKFIWCQIVNYGIPLMIQNQQNVHWMTPGERSSRPLIQALGSLDHSQTGIRWAGMIAHQAVWSDNPLDIRHTHLVLSARALKAIAWKIQHRFQISDLRICLRPLGVLSWMMKLAHGPLHAGYTKSHIRGYTPVNVCWILHAPLLKSKYMDWT